MCKVLVTFVLSFLLYLHYISSPCCAKEYKRFRANTVSAISGDIFIAEIGGEEYKIALAGIDAPEPNEPLRSKSTSYLQRLLAGGDIVLEPLCRDKNGRVVSYVSSASSKDVSAAMLENGMALPYILDDRGGRYLSPEKSLVYKAAAARAKHKKLGVWADKKTVSPFCVRNPKLNKCKTQKIF